MNQDQVTKRVAPGPTAVSPSSKRFRHFFQPLDPKIYLKSMNPPQVHDMIRDADSTVSIKTVANGLFHIVYVNKFASNEDAFDWPIYRAIQSSGTPMKFKNDTNFLRKFRFIAAAPRRSSKFENEPLYSASEGKNKAGNPIKYKQKCYVVVFDDNTSQGKKNICEHFANLLCNNEAQTSVKTEYDDTDPGNQSLDQYLTDETIMRLLHTTWRKKVDASFYKNSSQAVRDAIFSQPYPQVASEMLGYPEDYGANSDLDGVEQKDDDSLDDSFPQNQPDEASVG